MLTVGKHLGDRGYAFTPSYQYAIARVVKQADGTPDSQWADAALTAALTMPMLDFIEAHQLVKPRKVGEKACPECGCTKVVCPSCGREEERK